MNATGFIYVALPRTRRTLTLQRRSSGLRLKTRGDILSTVSSAASHLHKRPAQVLGVAHGCWGSPLAQVLHWLPGVMPACPLTWWSSKQTIIAWSMCEAESDGLATAVAEVSKIHPLLEALTGRSFQCQLKLFGDNSASITVANREHFFVTTWRTRDFARRAVGQHGCAINSKGGHDFAAPSRSNVDCRYVDKGPSKDQVGPTKLAQLRFAAGFQ